MIRSHVSMTTNPPSGWEFMRREGERELPWGRRRGGTHMLPARATRAVRPSQTQSIGQICLPVAFSYENQSHQIFIWTPKKVTYKNTPRMIYSLKKQPLRYPKLVSLLSLGARVQGWSFLRKREQPVPYLHVAARVGFDRVLSWKATLHNLIKARIPNILGKLQKQKSISGHSIINPFHGYTLLMHLMIYLMATKK